MGDALTRQCRRLADRDRKKHGPNDGIHFERPVPGGDAETEFDEARVDRGGNSIAEDDVILPFLIALFRVTCHNRSMIAVAQNPLLSIWLRPRETIRRIVTESPTKFVILFACILGAGRVLGRASSQDLGEEFSFAQIVLITVIFSPVNGFFMIWVYGWVIWWTGRLIGGIGSSKEIRAALAWGFTPAVVATFIWIPILLLAGPDIFKKEMPAPDGGIVRPPGVKALAGLQFILGVWALTLVCHTVAEVQGYASAWRGLENLALAGLALVLPAIAIGLILFAMR